MADKNKSVSELDDSLNALLAREEVVESDKYNILVLICYHDSIDVIQKIEGNNRTNKYASEFTAIGTVKIENEQYALIGVNRYSIPLCGMIIKDAIEDYCEMYFIDRKLLMVYDQEINEHQWGDGYFYDYSPIARHSNSLIDPLIRIEKQLESILLPFQQNPISNSVYRFIYEYDIQYRCSGEIDNKTVSRSIQYDIPIIEDFELDDDKVKYLGIVSSTANADFSTDSIELNRKIMVDCILEQGYTPDMDKLSIAIEKTVKGITPDIENCEYIDWNCFRMEHYDYSCDMSPDLVGPFDEWEDSLDSLTMIIHLPIKAVLESNHDDEEDEIIEEQTEKPSADSSGDPIESFREFMSSKFDGMKLPKGKPYGFVRLGNGFEVGFHVKKKGVTVYFYSSGKIESKKVFKWIDSNNIADKILNDTYTITPLPGKRNPKVVRVDLDIPYNGRELSDSDLRNESFDLNKQLLALFKPLESV